MNKNNIVLTEEQKEQLRKDLQATAANIDWEALGEAMQNAVEALTEVIQEAGKQLTETWEEIKRGIREMPDDKFDELLAREEVTFDQRLLLCSIRISGEDAPKERKYSDDEIAQRVLEMSDDEFEDLVEGEDIAPERLRWLIEVRKERNA